MKKLTLSLLALACLLSAFLFISCDPNGDDDDDDPPGDTVKIVCLGDSLTAGRIDGTDDPDHSYPKYLETKLKAIQDMSFEVINAGVSGDTAADGLARLNVDVIAKDPNVVVVCLGANDLMSLSAGSGPTDYQTVLDDFAAGLGDIIEALDDGERMILLAKFYDDDVMQGILDYCGFDGFPAADVVIDFDQIFSTIIDAASANVCLLDEDAGVGIWDSITLAMMSSDGLHPKAEGYEIMADNYFAGLNYMWGDE